MEYQRKKRLNGIILLGKKIDINSCILFKLNKYNLLYYEYIIIKLNKTLILK